MTVNDVSELTGVSVRTLHYYDEIGLLPPDGTTDAGYRLYGDKALGRLQVIMLFRELELPLKDISAILENPEFDRDKALAQQIEMLTLKRERLERLIVYAKNIRKMGGTDMDFTAFDSKKLEEYAEKAKKTWGGTDAYREYEANAKDRSKGDEKMLSVGLMEKFTELGKMRGTPAESAGIQAWVSSLQRYISENYYNCTKQILSGLGAMYASGGEFSENIDRAGGEGTAELAARAIEIFCADK